MSTTPTLQTTSPESPEPRRRREKRSRLGLTLWLLTGLVVLPSICLEIYVRLDDSSCDVWCESFGGTCETSYDEHDDNNCRRDGSDSCSSEHGDHICVCSR